MKNIRSIKREIYIVKFPLEGMLYYIILFCCQYSLVTIAEEGVETVCPRGNTIYDNGTVTSNPALFRTSISTALSNPNPTVKNPIST